MRYELTDKEWAAIKPMLPNKPRGVPRVNDSRVLLVQPHRQRQLDVLIAAFVAIDKILQEKRNVP